MDISVARELRKALTLAERKLWLYLQGEKFGVKFRRQYALGPFWNNNVLNDIETVLKVIWNVLREDEKPEKLYRGV